MKRLVRTAITLCCGTACAEVLGAGDLRFDRVPEQDSSGGVSGHAASVSGSGGRLKGNFGGASGSVMVQIETLSAGAGGELSELSGGTPGFGAQGFGGSLHGGQSSAGEGGVTESGGRAGAAGESHLGGVGGAAQDPLIPVLSGYGRYCSMRFGDGPAWAFAWGGSDPCAWIMEDRNWGPAEIKHAGLFDMNGKNSVVMYCYDNAARVRGHWIASGDRPLFLAYQEALNEYENGGCVFNVAPVRLPLFVSPFSLTPLPSGFVMSDRPYDFATLPGATGSTQATLNIEEYSQTPLAGTKCNVPSSFCAYTVSYRGEDRSGRPGDDNQGFDWYMDAGTPVRALADGVVIEMRTRAIHGCHSEQTELYIQHDVGSSLDSPYLESFVVYYAHLTFLDSLDVGSVVRAGEQIGAVGNHGCTNGQNQLHVAVLRVTNTARDYRPVLDTTAGIWGPSGEHPDNSVARIDPYGWIASLDTPHVDPGGHRWLWREIPFKGPAGTTRLGGGALSIQLWKLDQAPPRACDRNQSPWEVSGSSSLVNPFAICGN